MKKGILFTIVILTGACWLVSFQSDELAKSIKRGEEVYTGNCMSCHMDKGQGLESVFPPLAKADYLAKDKDGKKAIHTVLKGLSGEITVNGKKYNVDMPAQGYLTNEQIADVLNYVRNTWGNKGKMVTPKMVEGERSRE